MSRPRTLVLVAVVLAQIAVPLGLAGLAAADLAFGREIRVKAQPVDPLDIFRGNYVVLRYEFSSLPTGFDVDRGDRVCISLYKTGENEWRSGGSVTPERPSGGEAICGRAGRDAVAGGEVAVEYGIETYYASESRARELERSISRGQLYAVLDLDDDGSARIERIEVDE